MMRKVIKYIWKAGVGIGGCLVITWHVVKEKATVWAIDIKPPSEWLPTFGQTRTGGPDDVSRIVPLGGLDFIKNNLMSFLISGGVFLIIISSLIFLILGGIKMILGGGDKEATAKARATITYAIVGLVIGISSFIIVNIVLQLLGARTYNPGLTPSQ